MIEHGWGHWPEDPFSGEHPYDGTAGGLTGEAYGPGWHDEPPDGYPDHAHGWPDGTDGTDGMDAHAFDSGHAAGGSGHATDPHGAGHGTDPHGAGHGTDSDGGQAGVSPSRDGQPDQVAGAHADTDPPAPAVPAVDVFALHPEGSPFPPRLELDVVASDGRDWVDVDLLGEPGPGSAAALRFDSPADLLADLHRSDGADGDPSWQSLTGSDDPAVRALSLRWRH